MSAYLYILRCADSSYYVGTTVGSLETRVAEHQAGAYDGYTALRRPVTLMFHQNFERLDDAAAAERRVKGWRRDKKEALILGDFAALPSLARRGGTAQCVLRDSAQGPLLRMTMGGEVISRKNDKETPDAPVGTPLSYA